MRGADESLKVSVVAFREGELWVAQCIEYDISARSETLANAMTAFRRMFAANLAASRELGRNGLEGVPPAPQRFRQMFDAAKLVQENLPAGRSLSVTELRVLEAA
jgi:hypothetical protein